MKIIISSKTLYKTLLESLDRNAVKITISQDKLRFGLEQCEFLDIYCESKSTCRSEYPFDSYKWTRVKDLLRSIQEQPISVEIEEESIQITCIVVF